MRVIVDLKWQRIAIQTDQQPQPIFAIIWGETFHNPQSCAEPSVFKASLASKYVLYHGYLQPGKETVFFPTGGEEPVVRAGMMELQHGQGRLRGAIG